MFVLVLLSVLVGIQGDVPAGVLIEAVSVQRKDLPNDFPFRIFDQGFAILNIRVENRSEEDWHLEVEKIHAYDPKGKELDPAVHTEITPKLMKLRSGGGTAGIYGQGSSDVYRRRHPAHAHPMPTVTGGVDTGVGTVSAGKAQEIRAILERYEIHSAVLKPGEATEGYYYLKSKKSGRALSGGRVEVAGVPAGLK
jgi:hypothetical protein